MIHENITNISRKEEIKKQLVHTPERNPFVRALQAYKTTSQYYNHFRGVKSNWHCKHQINQNLNNSVLLYFTDLNNNKTDGAQHMYDLEMEESQNFVSCVADNLEEKYSEFD